MKETEEMDEPKVTQTHKAFSMTCGVEVNIRASAARIWSILTDAKGFPRWNSTVTGIDGRIREGEKIRVHAPGTDRTFTPRIAGVVPNRRMSWIGGSALLFKGVRSFELKPRKDGSTDFAIALTVTGLVAALWYMAWWIGVLVLVVAILSTGLVVVVLIHSQPPDSEAEKELKRRYADYRRQQKRGRHGAEPGR
jgi:uncharacterized protein YndB with AHSA1/START domain